MIDLSRIDAGAIGRRAAILIAASLEAYLSYVECYKLK